MGLRVFFGSLLPLSWLGQALERATAWKCGRGSREVVKEECREGLGGGRPEGWRRGSCVGNEVFSFHPQKAVWGDGPGSEQLHNHLCLWSVLKAAPLCTACMSQLPSATAELQRDRHWEGPLQSWVFPLCALHCVNSWGKSWNFLKCCLCFLCVLVLFYPVSLFDCYDGGGGGGFL